MNANPSVRAVAPPALNVEHVSHAYGARKALDDVSLVVQPGVFAVLLGLNGAGKSTLFSIVTRLYASRTGTVRIFGHDVARASFAALAELGVVFQSRTLDPDLSVEQNMLYQGALHGLSPGDSKARARDLVGRVGLADRWKDRVRALSGGQSRRIEIARALLHAPRLVLLDEPTAGLDIKARAGILALTRRLVDEDRVGILWTTHLVDEVRPEDQVVVLHKGRVLACDSARAVMRATGADSVGAAFGKLTGGAGEDDA